MHVGGDRPLLHNVKSRAAKTLHALDVGHPNCSGCLSLLRLGGGEHEARRSSIKRDGQQAVLPENPPPMKVSVVQDEEDGVVLTKALGEQVSQAIDLESRRLHASLL